MYPARGAYARSRPTHRIDEPAEYAKLLAAQQLLDEQARGARATGRAAPVTVGSATLRVRDHPTSLGEVYAPPPFGGQPLLDAFGYALIRTLIPQARARAPLGARRAQLHAAPRRSTPALVVAPHVCAAAAAARCLCRSVACRWESFFAHTTQRSPRQSIRSLLMRLSGTDSIRVRQTSLPAGRSCRRSGRSTRCSPPSSASAARSSCRRARSIRSQGRSALRRARRSSAAFDRASPCGCSRQATAHTTRCPSKWPPPSLSGGRPPHWSRGRECAPLLCNVLPVAIPSAPCKFTRDIMATDAYPACACACSPAPCKLSRCSTRSCVSRASPSWCLS
mgnify:CR=1 FL=1